MKNLTKLTFLLLCFCYSSINAQSVFDQMSDPYFGESCTSITVARKASTDGSVITSHTCDGRYRTWLKMEQAATYAKDTSMQIFKGKLKTETAWDMRNVQVAGKIAQVKSTYAFLNTAYPCINEKQLAIGETTIVGPKELVNDKGMFLIEELERVALQRCTNARDAITLIGSLIKQYGYGDWGECITIADKKEVWQMEIFGQGPDKIGGVWAAQRIPDNHIGISANISRISVLNLDKSDYYMASENVFSAAKELKRWDGKEEFKFWKVYGGIDKPYKIREFFVFNHFAPSLKLNMDLEELPFSIKPDNKVSVRDIIAMYRETYEDTKYDMTQNMLVVKKKYNKKKELISTDTVKAGNATPWPSRNTRNSANFLKENTIEYQRTVAVSWCSYSHITQLRDWLPDAIGGRVWFSFDNPGQSPRIPIYCGSTKLPESFNFCGQKRYRADAAIWKFRKANKLATVAWQQTKKGMFKEIKSLEDKAFEETASLEKRFVKQAKKDKKGAIESLDRYTNEFTGTAASKWKQLEEKYWGMFGMGF